MSTANATRASLLRRHPEIVGGPLAVALFALALTWNTGDSILPHYIAYTAAGVAAFLVGVLSPLTPVRISSWLAVGVCWVPSILFGYNAALSWDEAGAWVAATVIGALQLAALAAAMLWAAWRRPHSAVEGKTAQVVVIVLIAVTVFLGYALSVFDDQGTGTIAVAPIAPIGAAVLFVAAGSRRLDRAVGYGALALLTLAFGAWVLLNLDLGRLPLPLLWALLIATGAAAFASVAWQGRRDYSSLNE